MITARKALLSIGLAIALCALYRPLPACAAATISLVPTGDGLFTIHGIGVEGAVSMDITVTYDPSTGDNPQVVQGRLISGAVMTVSARDAGVVRIGVLRDAPMSGTGAIATLNFDRKGESPGLITGLSARLTDMRGTPFQAQTQFLNSTDKPMGSGLPWSDSTSTAGGNPAVTGPTTTAAPAAIVPGVLIGAGELVIPAKEAPVPVPEEPAPSRQVFADTPAPQTARRSPGTAADAATRKEKKTVVMQKSVLERFAEYRGARTPEALIGLFDQDPLLGCRQEPPLLLADGKAQATVTFVAPAELRRTPDVAMMNASLVSVERDRESTNTWVATVRPSAGSADARMTISLPDKTLVIPLTVAPKVALPKDASGIVNRESFAAYLRGEGGKGSKGRDLNGDGIVDHVDFYIYTANYLAGSIPREQSAPALPGK